MSSTTPTIWKKRAFRAAEAYAFTDGIGAGGEGVLDEGLVDDGDGGCVRGIVRREGAAEQDPGADGVEVFGGDAEVGGVERVVGMCLGL